VSENQSSDDKKKLIDIIVL